MSSALQRFRVIDLTTVRSGPTCTKVLADFGAEVLRVERPGESARSRAFNLVHALQHPLWGLVKALALPVSLSRTPPQVRTPASLPGQHTREVLEGLGYDRPTIEGLLADGIIEEAKGETP